MTEIDDSLRTALAELEDYLDGVPDERVAELTLPFASRWVLPELGFDLPRLQEEADTFVKATPLSDRILSSYPGQVGYWVEQRMALDGDAATQLRRAETMLAERAQLVEDEGFPRVAAGLRRAAGDPLWSAIAQRIAESVLP
ncbi:hypothetical protein OM076_04065 [Solirubrobacter ginsenosidimutans]|uniref:Uncharacterized protein n=1 Tax=Solirubrobacter ginsenosidimutans TaxID=490573 RepID=A0A9X3MND3_9ACTN|nr:hypothetical protein [Solirubrobacter ginsenosidimutans]MDA0159429.1 hypothetical protein [Solirubrobacter ginsenosidimutans]